MLSRLSLVRWIVLCAAVSLGEALRVCMCVQTDTRHPQDPSIASHQSPMLPRFVLTQNRGADDTPETARAVLQRVAIMHNMECSGDARDARGARDAAVVAATVLPLARRVVCEYTVPEAYRPCGRGFTNS